MTRGETFINPSSLALIQRVHTHSASPNVVLPRRQESGNPTEDRGERTVRPTEMINTYPAEISLDRDLLARVVDTLVACSQACTACADACLSEDTVGELRKFIRNIMECSGLSYSHARALSRRNRY